MSTQTLPFQAPVSLLGTLAAYEAGRASAGSSPVSRHGTSTHPESTHSHLSPSADEIYKRALPSLHFLRWRPMYHLQATSGWMNDPCAPGYDPSTGLYHLFFQWNPRRNIYGAVAWGNISWGHSTSKDMIHWTVSGNTALKPGSWYDKEGCFTGCMIPTSLDGRPGDITLFYTGVSRLPLHYTLPYQTSTETLAVAQSANGGTSFTKMRGNPIHPQAPAGVSVTGWRDPYVAQWESMDECLGRPNDEITLYGVISGGIRDTTPTAFLYAVNPQNLAQWVYIAAIINLGLNHNISRWSGDMGINWECANFMTLKSDVDGSSREFIVVGGEGSDTMHPNSTFAAYPHEETKFPRAERSLQWMCGSLRAVKESDGTVKPTMDYVSGGRFDHAAMYGVNTFHDPQTNKQIAWGWITEEDLPQRLVDRQNWSGMLSIPRELSLVCIQKVTGAVQSKLSEITSFELEADSEDSWTVRTLGISPASSVEKLRQGAKHITLEHRKLSSLQDCFLDVQTLRFELAAAFSISDECSKIGLSIHHTEDGDLTMSTTIALLTKTETMTVERPDSTHVDPEIVRYTEQAPFTLLSQRQTDGNIMREQLQLRAFFDESVLEVFVNDRCTFATRIYPGSKRCWGVTFWAEDTSQESSLIGAQAWDGLRADIRVAG